MGRLIRRNTTCQQLIYRMDITRSGLSEIGKRVVLAAARLTLGARATLLTGIPMAWSARRKRCPSINPVPVTSPITSSAR
ncbi:MAG: hypothetical protein QOH57_4731 [Mycobacterium sp.]|nr:hypothetical protein [Mycobacterium sp.]